VANAKTVLFESNFGPINRTEFDEFYKDSYVSVTATVANVPPDAIVVLKIAEVDANDHVNLNSQPNWEQNRILPDIEKPRRLDLVVLTAIIDITQHVEIMQKVEGLPTKLRTSMTPVNIALVDTAPWISSGPVHRNGTFIGNQAVSLLRNFTMTAPTTTPTAAPTTTPTTQTPTGRECKIQKYFVVNAKFNNICGDTSTGILKGQPCKDTPDQEFHMDNSLLVTNEKCISLGFKLVSCGGENVFQVTNVGPRVNFKTKAGKCMQLLNKSGKMAIRKCNQKRRDQQFYLTPKLPV